MNPSRYVEGHWYQQPVVWLGLAIFVASLAGCVWMIVLGARYADPPVAIEGEMVFKVPSARPVTTDDPTRDAP